jgi:C4-type Zn-finger protein
MTAGCPKCGGVYTYPESNNGAVYPDPLVEQNVCTTCGFSFQVVIN